MFFYPGWYPKVYLKVKKARENNTILVAEVHLFKVIPLKLFYYQTVFETWCN